MYFSGFTITLFYIYLIFSKINIFFLLTVAGEKNLKIFNEKFMFLDASIILTKILTCVWFGKFVQDSREDTSNSNPILC